MHNPYNSNPVFSSKVSLTIFGFGLSGSNYSYDLGNSWTTSVYDYGTNPNGDFVYKSGFGFRRGRLDYSYDFEIPLIKGFH